MKLYCLRRFFSLLLKDEGLGENSGNNAGVVWCGVVWCGVVWCGVGLYTAIILMSSSFLGILAHYTIIKTPCIFQGVSASIPKTSRKRVLVNLLAPSMFMWTEFMNRL